VSAAMGGDARSWALLAACLVLAGALAWWIQLREAVDSDPTTLGALPTRIAGHEGRDIPIEQAAEAMLQADFHVQREYAGPFGEPVWLYVGYYGTVRGGTPEHTPRACYTAHGWRIRAEQSVVVDRERGSRAREYRVEVGGHEQLVHFWYRTFRGTGLLSLSALRVDHFVGRLLTGRADGALVRLSTPLRDGDVVAARSRLLGFAAALEPLLEDHWPPAQGDGGPPRGAAAGEASRSAPAGGPG
jgi:EpsI family protein